MNRYSIYKSKAWEDIRINYARSKNCLCERCGKPIYMSGVSEYIPKEKRLKGIVHHKIHLDESNYIDDSIAYDWNNLELLCIKCHNEEHFTKGSIRSDYVFDDEGNIKPKHTLPSWH